jgi:RES domain-containing protein
VTARVDWHPSYRLIASRLPRLNIFESVADPRDLEAVLEIEALTNPRLRPALGALDAIPVEDRVAGPGAAFVMAPFAYPQNARFSDERRGAYYAAETLTTAIAEVSFHRARFAAQTATPPMDFDERIVEADVAATLEDVRGLPASDSVYDPDPAHYARAQAFAAGVRTDGGAGIVYTSVRAAGGTCVAVFVPRLVTNARTTGYVGLRWDGAQIVDAYRKESLGAPYPGEPPS